MFLEDIGIHWRVFSLEPPLQQPMPPVRCLPFTQTSPEHKSTAIWQMRFAADRILSDNGAFFSARRESCRFQPVHWPDLISVPD